MRDGSAGSSELFLLLVFGLKNMCESIRITVLRIAFVVLTLGRMSSGKRVAAESASLVDVAAASDEAACFNFSVGAPSRREFYSPNYPNHYPKNTKCTLRITADAGHMVMLDFRDQFRLEQSGTCEYDRLEVRDGAYGYSPLIGQFCGPDFPSKLYSSKRYMWLQFSSDDSIEYEGFRAVYDYVPVPNQGQNGHDNDRECAYHRGGSSGLIEKSEIDLLWHKYRQEDTIECMWTIETEAGKQLYMNFIKYRLDKPNDCDQNFVQLFGDGRTPDKQLNKFCGTTAEPQKSPANVTHVRLFTHKSAFNGTDFALHYTAFREIRKEEQCDPKTEFNCGDQTCVDISLKCDGQFDCKYSPGRGHGPHLRAHDHHPGGVLLAGGGDVRLHLHLVLQQGAGAADPGARIQGAALQGGLRGGDPLLRSVGATAVVQDGGRRENGGRRELGRRRMLRAGTGHERVRETAAAETEWWRHHS